MLVVLKICDVTAKITINYTCCLINDVSLHHWFNKTWNLIHRYVYNVRLNASKCEVMHICRSTCTAPQSHYHIKGTDLSSVNSIKYLGIQNNNKLSFDEHILKLCGKASTVLYMLMRNLKKAKRKTRETA